MGSAQSISCATLSASCAEGSVGSAQSTSFAISSASCAARSGKYQVEPELTALSNETVTVLDIGLYRVPIKNGRGMMILHDFVGLRVRFGDGCIFKIRAEKCKEGISVKQSRPDERWDTDDVQMKHRAEELQDCGVIRMEDLLAILKEPSPKYSLMSDNCWWYADATFKQVIRKFLETPSLTPDRRSYLERFLNNPPPVMPVFEIIFCCFTFAQGSMGPIFMFIVDQAERQWVAELVARGYPIASSVTPAWFGLLPVYISVGLATVLLLCKVVTFVKGGTSLGQFLKKWWRSLFSRRRLMQAQGLPSM